MEDGMKNRDDDTTIMTIKAILSQLPKPEVSDKIKEVHLDSIHAALSSRGDIFARNDFVVLQSHDGHDLRIPIKKLPVKIGRGKNMVDYLVDNKGVSRVHFWLERSGALVRIRDAGSSNGTFLNRKRITQDDIRVGDEIVVGTSVFTVDRQ